MNQKQKYFIHILASAFITFIMCFFMSSWSVISGFQAFFESGQNVELTAFVYEGVPEEKIQNFINTYRKHPEVIAISRQTAEESFKALKAELKIFDFQMKGVDMEQVLPQIITLKLRHLDTRLINELKLNRIVDELLDGRHWLQKNESIIQVLKGASILMAILCLSSLVLSLTLLIKTQVQIEKDEISLRAMHGESLWSLKKSYVIKSLGITLFGTCMGIILSSTAASILQTKVLTQFQIQNLAEQIKPLGPEQAFPFIAVCLLVGGIVGYMQTARFEKDFYLQR
ncbi:MAG: FtsX-like permease family protein [Bdellovibrionota bacterium]